MVASPESDVRPPSGRFLNHTDGLAACVCAGAGVCRSAAAHRLRINRMFVSEAGARSSRNLSPRPLLNPAWFF